MMTFCCGIHLAYHFGWIRLMCRCDGLHLYVPICVPVCCRHYFLHLMPLCHIWGIYSSARTIFWYTEGTRLSVGRWVHGRRQYGPARFPPGPCTHCFKSLYHVLMIVTRWSTSIAHWFIVHNVPYFHPLQRRSLYDKHKRATKAWYGGVTAFCPCSHQPRLHLACFQPTEIWNTALKILHITWLPVNTVLIWRVKTYTISIGYILLKVIKYLREHMRLVPLNILSSILHE